MMNLKEVRCPNCNINISILDNTTKYICQHCNHEFIIDNNNQINANNLLNEANNTLNQLKDYDKSLNLYKELLQKYNNKREIYIGLIRCITKDFTISNINGYKLNEINEYFKKYKILATEEEFSKYDNLIKELNKNYWYNTLIMKTNEFNSQIINEEIKVIENCYNNFTKYCNKNENIIKEKYEQYLVEYKNLVDKKQKKKNTIIKITISIFIISLLILIYFIIK